MCGCVLLKCAVAGTVLPHLLPDVWNHQETFPYPSQPQAHRRISSRSRRSLHFLHLSLRWLRKKERVVSCNCLMGRSAWRESTRTIRSRRAHTRLCISSINEQVAPFLILVIFAEIRRDRSIALLFRGQICKTWVIWSKYTADNLANHHCSWEYLLRNCELNSCFVALFSWNLGEQSLAVHLKFRI